MKPSGALIVAALAVVIYLPTLANGYVFDDIPVVHNNPVVRELRYVEAVAGPYWPALEGVRPGSSNWRPLATLSFVIERAVLGVTHPIVHHLINAVLHGLVVLALYPLARRLVGGGWPALAACALFAAHPAHTEAVAPVVGRTDLLAGLGALLALECFLRYRDGGPHAQWSLWLGAAAFALGLGGKESAAPVILLLPAADWLVRGESIRSLIGRPALAYLPYAAVLAIYLVARFAVLGEASFHHAAAVEYSMPQRLLFASRNAVVSAGLLLVPTRFHHMVTTLPDNADFTYADPTGLAAAGFLLGGVIAAFGWLALVRPAPRGAFLWLGALATWLPTSGLLATAAGTSMRFLFLPTAWAACGAALVATRLVARRPALRSLVVAAVVMLVVLGAVISVRRGTQWRNNGTFYGAVVAGEPGCFTAHYSLGSWYTTRRPPDLRRARDHFGHALHIAEGTAASFQVHMALAVTYEFNDDGTWYGTGAQLPEAIAIYRRLIEEYPDRWEAYLNLGSALEQLHNQREAVLYYRRFLELAPESPQANDVRDRMARIEGR